MYCVVRHCKSIWRPNSDIRFHSFPKNEVRRRQWLSIVPLKGKFSGRSTICSLHFKRDDYDPDRPGRLRNTAAPFFMPDACSCDAKDGCHCISSAQKLSQTELKCDKDSVDNDHSYEMMEVEVKYEQEIKENMCKVCLATGLKLYDMDNYNLKTLYEELTNCNLTPDAAPHWLCWECAFRLMSCERFKRKALRSRALLERLPFGQYDYMQQLQSIDRQKHHLTSTLVSKHINHIDVHIHDETEDTTEEIHTNQDIDIDEIEYLSNEYISDEPIHEINIDDNDVIENVDRTYINIELDTEEPESNEEASIVPKKRTKKRNGETKSNIGKKRKPGNLTVLNEAIFSITDLSLEEQIEEIEKRKETANYKKSVFKCNLCFKGFKHEEAFKGHVIRHSDQCGTFECAVCKIRFKNRHRMRTHLGKHKQKFTCLCCPYVTNHRSCAKLHEEWHNGTRYKCPHCPEEFEHMSSYMGHVRIKHPSDWVCALCGNSFVSEHGLSQHKKVKHRLEQQPVPEDGPYCESCDMRFASLEAIERHNRVSARHDYDIHKQERQFYKRSKRTASECEGDGKKLVGPIACEQCDAQLPDPRSYHHHFRRMHPDKNRTIYPSKKSTIMCEVCGKIFQSLAMLRDHGYTHTDVKPYKCEQCGKSYQRAACLLQHRALHREPRAAYECGLCGKHFSSPSNRRKHMVIHTGLKPFKCEMCGKCFKHASEKRAHITYVHLKKPWPKRARGRRDRQVQSTEPIEEDSESLSPQPKSRYPKVVVIKKPVYGQFGKKK